MLPVVVAASALVMSLPRTGAQVTIKIVERDGRQVFEPALVHVDPGQRVEFLNETTQTHTATCLGCSLDVGDIQPGQSKFVVFSDARSYGYGCRYHPGESGRIVVGDAEESPAPSPSPAFGQTMPGMPDDSMSGHTMPGMPDGAMSGH